MATVIKIGTATDLAGSTAYDLRDSTQNNIHMVQLNSRAAPVYDSRKGAWLESFALFVEGNTVANIIASEKEIRDFLAAAEEYTGDDQEDDPVYLRDHADGETAKQAVIIEGELTPIPQAAADQSLVNLQCYYRLNIYRGEWEPTAEVTFIDEEEMDGDTNTLQITSIKGDQPGRKGFAAAFNRHYRGQAEVAKGHCQARQGQDGPGKSNELL